MPQITSNLISAKDTPLKQLSWRDQRYVRFYEVVDLLVDLVQQYAHSDTGQSKRRVKGDQLEKLHYSIECLVRDCLAVAFHRKRKGEAAIKKGQHHYAADRSDHMLTYSIHIQRAFTTLEAMGFLKVTQKGSYDRVGLRDGSRQSRLTRYVATDRLLALFTEHELAALPAIVPAYNNPQLIRVNRTELSENGLKRRVKVSFTETDETARIRANLQVINKALSRNWYDLEIEDEELLALQRRLAASKTDERRIRLDHRTLYRVFNDPDLTTGGRFYGGWWQNIPKKYRQVLAVNGKQMVELDYSNQHPAILYAQQGLVRPLDCYTGVIAPKKLRDDHDGLRDQIKKAFNAMLNAKEPMKRAPKTINLTIYGLTWRETSEAIMAFHKPIAHHFYSGAGLRLQRIDSDIAEKILLHFTSKGIPILPLHDSFLMHHGYESSLEPIMVDVFEEVVGAKPKIDKKVKQTLHSLELPGQSAYDAEPVSDDVKELLAAMQGHDHRLDAFRALTRQR